MKKIVRATLIGATFLFFLGCGPKTETEESSLKTEKGIVEDVVYSPHNHGDGISPGMTTEGNLTISVTSVDIPAKYAVVFRCADHGVKFVVEGTSPEYKKLWEKLKRDDSVVISYKEIYEITTWKDSTTTKVVDLKFVDANPFKK